MGFAGRTVSVKKGSWEMGFVISDQILSETKECTRGFFCLKTVQDKDHKICEVLDANGENVLFLKSKRIAECPYQISFGESLICTCPTRYAIHEKYRK